MWYVIVRHRNPKFTIREKCKSYFQARAVIMCLNEHDMEDIISVSVERI